MVAALGLSLLKERKSGTAIPAAPPVATGRDGSLTQSLQLPT